MNEPVTQILQRTSDPVAVIRLADGVIVDINDALPAATGRPPRELVGRPANDLFVGIGPTSSALIYSSFSDLGAIADVPIGVRTRSGDLRIGQLFVRVTDVQAQRDAVCRIRDLRDPTARERRLAAREELSRVLHHRGPWPDAATSALDAVGRQLRWDFGALWPIDRRAGALRCEAVWRTPWAGLERLEERALRTSIPRDAGLLLARTWSSGEPAWVSDAAADPEFRRWIGENGKLVGGHFTLPAFSGGQVVGVVEFASIQIRDPDEELLQMAGELGELFGKLIDHGRPVSVVAPSAGYGPEAMPVSADLDAARLDTVSTALRDVAGIVGAIADALERSRFARGHGQAADLTGELATEVGKLNRILDDAAIPGGDLPPHAISELPTGLTLKAVSQRTGIPAATLRTWERRYRFMRPIRSASGYRLYSERDIARILQVKYLLQRGVRIRAAMAAVTDATAQPGPPERATQETRPPASEAAARATHEAN
jgi:DNA-binding transcriptional MerR regulator